MNYLFTSESVSEGHPDKVADQISDAILDNFIAQDPASHVACETLVTTGQVIVAGEVKSDNAYVDLQSVVRRTIKHIGYTKSAYMFDHQSCGVLTCIHEQSADIDMGVSRENPEEQGAGDQGMMFGYATNETSSFMPITLAIAHALVDELAIIRHQEPQLMPYLRPDAKSQVTVEYDDKNHPLRIDTIVVSTQHDADVSLEKIYDDVKNILIPRVRRRDSKFDRLFNGEFKLLVNPTGRFEIGGPHGDTGLTGRKIIVDTYGGRGAHGGGAFSGKDPSKVDRSAAYAARHIAKNLVAAGVADEILVEVAYAIGVARPVSIYVNTYGTSHVNRSDAEIAQVVEKLFDLRPYAIEQRLNLRQPIYQETARNGHMGHEPQIVTKTLLDSHGHKYTRQVELFTWEKLDHVEKVKTEFGLC